MPPALALAYLFWTRHRRSLTLVGGYWLVVMILYQVVPRESYFFEPMVFLFLCACLIATTGYLVLVFTFSREVRLEGCESGFPARLWTLPLPTLALTGWPMLWGSATMILGWMMLAWAARRPYESDVPLLWPGLLLAVVLAWLQAIVWTPLPLPWVRAFLFIPVSIVLVFTTMAVLALDVPSVAVCGLLTVLLLAAYWTAVRGAVRARSGATVQWSWPVWLRLPRTTRTRSPFRSAAHAQLWLEWRLHGIVFPMTAASCLVLALPILLIAKHLDPVDRVVPPLLQSWQPVASVMVWILAIVWTCGMDIGRLGRGTYRLSSFWATRPISEAMLVRPKFVTAACSTLAGWGVLVVGFLVWLALSGYTAEATRQLAAMEQRYPPGLFWGWLFFLVVGAVGLTWLQVVQLMWIGLSGSPRVTTISFYGFAAFAGLIVFGCWLAYNPEYWPIFARLLPWLAGAAVLLKSLAAAWSLHALKSCRLIPSAVLWGMPAIWFALAAGVFATLYALLPDNWFSVPGVVLGIVLLLPLTRLALAPLALYWNRHR